MDNYDEVLELEAVFRQRWLKTERFFSPNWSGDEWIRPILHLMYELHDKGYHKELRAGQSLYTLVLSRSRHHRLGSGQAYIRVKPLYGGGAEVVFRNKDYFFHFGLDTLENSFEIEILVQALIQEPLTGKTITA